MTDTKIDKSSMMKAKELTNVLFDKGFLADDLTRESIDWLEDYIGYILYSNAESAAKCALLIKDIQGMHVPRKKSEESENDPQ